MAPPGPRAGFQSLPPILRIPGPDPVPSCSKAPRGLFVLPRVTRIFTGTSISPSPSLRQRPSRYAIRAGRNLPDKEFRYLRTDIVTAAVHWGFGLELLPTNRDNPAPSPSSTGQASAPILQLSLWQRPVFLLNSRLGRLSAAPKGYSASRGSTTPAEAGRVNPKSALLHPQRHPLSLSYGVILPSSLTRVLSITFSEFGAPTCVGFGTGANTP